MNHPFFIRNDLTKHDLRSVLEADLISLNLGSLKEKIYPVMSSVSQT